MKVKYLKTGEEFKFDGENVIKTLLCNHTDGTVTKDEFPFFYDRKQYSEPF